MLALLLACITNKDVERAQARVDLGHAYILEGNAEAAIATLREATKLNRRDVEAWHYLALAYMKRGANEEAEKAFKRAIRLDKEDAAIRLNYAYLLQNLGRVDEAVEQLEIARQDLTYDQPAKVLNNLGWGYLSMGRTQDAVVVLTEAVTRQPNFCGAWYNLGLAQEAAGQPAKALDSMERVRTMCSSDFPEATLKAGELLMALGRKEEGAMYLDLVQQTWPGTPEATRAAERMAAANP